jgi:hypothetical protein
MLRHAFRSVDAVVFRVHSLNFRSQRAVEKLGAVRVGTEVDPHGRGENLVFRLGRQGSSWSELSEAGDPAAVDEDRLAGDPVAGAGAQE